GARATELALRVLRGDRTPPGDFDTNVYRFDARQLQRWRLDARRLPAGSVILFDEPSVWRQYGAYFAGGLVLLLVQSALIAALLAQLSALFASHHGGEVDQHIEDALRRIVEDLDVDRATVGQLPRVGDKAEITHAWTRQGIPPLPNVLDSRLLPWIVSRVRQGQAVSLARPEDLPAEAEV